VARKYSELEKSIEDYIDASNDVWEEQLSGLSEETRAKIKKVLKIADLDFRLDISQKTSTIMEKIL
jgi:hypothetical protein